MSALLSTTFVNDPHIRPSSTEDLFPTRNRYKLLKCKKVKLSLCLINSALCHENIWGSGCIDPRILDLGTSWSWVISFTSRPLYPGERVPGNHRTGGWVGSWTGLDDEEKRKPCSYWDSNSDHSAAQPVSSRFTDLKVSCIFWEVILFLGLIWLSTYINT
jgi:hypothetical protein